MKTEYQWIHFTCAKLKCSPKGIWYYKECKKHKNVTKASVIDQFLPNIPNYGRPRGRSCKWEHLKETIFKRKTFSIAKEETRLNRVIRG